MNLSKFLKFKKKPKTVSLRKSIDIDPFFYWKNILVMMLIVLIAVLLLSIGIYYFVSKGKFVNKQSKDAVKELELTTLNEKALKNIIDTFDARDAKREEIIKSKTILPNPALPKTPAVSVPATGTTAPLKTN